MNVKDKAMFDRITFDPNIMGGRACILTAHALSGRHGRVDAGRLIAALIRP
jgi:hypothetical protein